MKISLLKIWQIDWLIVKHILFLLPIPNPYFIYVILTKGFKKFVIYYPRTEFDNNCIPFHWNQHIATVSVVKTNSPNTIFIELLREFEEFNRYLRF